MSNTNSRLGALAVMSFALMLLGAGCGSGKTPQSAKTPTNKPAVKEIIEPLKLVYELKNYGPTGPSGKLSMTLWLEGKQQCAGREAYLGVMKMDNTGPNSSSAWAKVTIYADNGEMAISRFDHEDKLAFDDLKAEYNQFDIALTMNSIFAYAGQNFNSSEAWSATSPVILKDVDSGMSITNYSIIRQDEQTGGVAPCQKFKIVSKGTNMEGTLKACVAKELGQIKLPFVVSFAFDSQGRPSPGWELKSYAKETSGVASAVQCLEPVKCVYLKEPTPAERSSCGARSGRIEQRRDDKGCVTENACLTQDDIANETITRTQGPGCPINPEVKKKYLKCMKDSQPNLEVTRSTEEGCTLDIACR